MCKVLKTIIFVETNKSGSSREAIRAAEHLGYYTVLFTNRRKYLEQREEFPDIHEMILLNTKDIKEMVKCTEKLQSQGKVIDGVISFVDSYVSSAIEFSESLGLEGFTLAPVKIMEDKVHTRYSLNGCSANVSYAVYEQGDSLESFINNLTINTPHIVKAPGSTGSKDVYLVENKKELVEVMNELSQIYPSQSILIEEYIEGPQWLIETLVVDGNVEIIAVIEQEITKVERFIITGYYSVIDLESSLFWNIRETLNEIIGEIGLKKGSCHFELRRVEEQWKLIEVNPRISGGAMNSMVLHSLGINVVEQTLRLYLDLPLDLTPVKREIVYTHYLTISTKGRIVKITGKNRAARAEGVKEVYIKPRKGMVVHPPTSMGHRYGYIMTAAETKEKAKELALSAAKEIRFYIEEQE